MSSDLTYTLQVPRTSLRVTVDESTDVGAWEPLDRDRPAEKGGPDHAD